MQQVNAIGSKLGLGFGQEGYAAASVVRRFPVVADAGPHCAPPLFAKVSFRWLWFRIEVEVGNGLMLLLVLFTAVDAWIGISTVEKHWSA